MRVQRRLPFASFCEIIVNIINTIVIAILSIYYYYDLKVRPELVTPEKRARPNPRRHAELASGDFATRHHNLRH
jgi:hypothetical protein